jgi:hypothetical protein
MFIANLFNRSQLPINLIASVQINALVLESEIWRNLGATLARAVGGVFGVWGWWPRSKAAIAAIGPVMVCGFLQ